MYGEISFYCQTHIKHIHAFFNQNAGNFKSFFLNQQSLCFKQSVFISRIIILRHLNSALDFTSCLSSTLILSSYLKLRIANWFSNSMYFKPLNAELNLICHLLALLGAHHILRISRIKVNISYFPYEISRHLGRGSSEYHFVYYGLTQQL
jgi:hypothetical protein